MIDIKIDVSDAIAKLNSISDAELARTIANDVADEAVLPELAKYPSASGRPQPPRSAAQRRKIFALLKAGQIPYRRTGATGRSYHKVATGEGVDVTSTLASAVYTRGSPQAAYFKGTWPTHEEVAKKIEGDTAELIGVAAVIKLLDKAGLT